MGQKLIKIAQKSRCFCTFSVFVLLQNNYAGSREGPRAPVPHTWRRHCVLHMENIICTNICSVDLQCVIVWFTQARADSLCLWFRPHDIISDRLSLFNMII